MLNLLKCLDSAIIQFSQNYKENIYYKNDRNENLLLFECDKFKDDGVVKKYKGYFIQEQFRNRWRFPVVLKIYGKSLKWQSLAL